MDRIRDAPCCTVSFDECMNKIFQNDQMDFIVRYWDSNTGQVSVRYLGSEFIDHATATDLLTHFKDGIRGPKATTPGPKTKEISSMDWCSTHKLCSEMT